MDFFKSVFSDDPDSTKPGSVSESPGNAHKNEEQEDPDSNSSPNDHQSNPNGSDGGGWSFGGLMKTLSSKSESVIETYRRDLKEFSSGLKKEIEVAQGSLGTVGHVIDEFGNTVLKGTAQIVSQGKDTILAVDVEYDSDNSTSFLNNSQQSLNSKPYSRFDSQVRTIQGDASTYCEEPEDMNDYNKWKLEFSLNEKYEETEDLLEENNDVDSIYKMVVPNSVDHETFWTRYYYRVHKIKQTEVFRAKLVSAISREEEELSWDVDDDEENESKVEADIVNNKEDLGGNAKDAGLQVGSSVADAEDKKSTNIEKSGDSVGESKGEMRNNLLQNREPDNDSEPQPIVRENLVQESKVESLGVVDEKEYKSSNVDHGSNASVRESSTDKTSQLGGDTEVNKTDSVSKSDEKVALGRTADLGESSNKDNNTSLISRQPSVSEDEDLGWDEIEDLSSIEDKKPTQSGTPNKADLRKRLSAAEEDEDLSWDIEDDDEPVKT
ncbi:BSD domain-containing protein 1 [Quillaja saponaria]|uniref:BSD domain-containing protein 1 n=1 Tax=Quillaja saponaria TaxID=32244 RepID=A0AAD7Q0Z1_QUISA|nr:BSD domain-containing protein 1 [Quillaja saponaria]KAJ7972844.1 BSD domain-containing protein 1 [Quillaja saponaria]